MKRMSKYLVLVKASIKETLEYRLSLYVTLFGNIIYLIITYYLWTAIFASADKAEINGMTLSSTIIYVVLGATIGNCLEVYVVWDIGRNIQSGQIILDLLKPMKYRQFMLNQVTGKVIGKFLTNFIPVYIVTFFLIKDYLVIGPNVLFFIISFAIGALINYYLNFIIGTICIYTESIWGINIMKTVVISLLSGMTIPISFFPPALKRVVEFLPFQSICNVPLTILLDRDNEVKQYLIYIGIQLIWALALMLFTEFLWNKSIKKITVNGG